MTRLHAHCCDLCQPSPVIRVRAHRICWYKFVNVPAFTREVFESGTQCLELFKRFIHLAW